MTDEDMVLSKSKLTKLREFFWKLEMERMQEPDDRGLGSEILPSRRDTENILRTHTNCN